MSSMREITIMIPCREHAHLAEVAKQVIAEIEQHAEGDARRDALMFLRDLIAHRNWVTTEDRVDRNSCWSIDGNYSDTNLLIAALRPFWLALYAYRFTKPIKPEVTWELMEYDLSCVTILSQHEQDDYTTLHRLRVTEERTIVIKEVRVNLEFD